MTKKYTYRQNQKKKERVISTRIAEIEYYALKKRASDAGVTLSKFCRSVLLTGKVVQRISPEDGKVLRLLSNEANNINQLARKANSEGFSNVAMDLTKLRKVIVNIINHLSDDWKGYEKRSI